DQVSADSARLQQVFWNLVNNAIKFTPDGGVVTLRTTNPTTGRLHVEVTDTGVGIPPELLPRLFQPFNQGEQTITRQFGGLGLGLAIVKAILDLHGAAVLAESDGVGTGSRFSV